MTVMPVSRPGVVEQWSVLCAMLVNHASVVMVTVPGGGVLDEDLAGEGGALAQVVVDDPHRLLVTSQEKDKCKGRQGGLRGGLPVFLAELRHSLIDG